MKEIECPDCDGLGYKDCCLCSEWYEHPLECTKPDFCTCNTCKGLGKITSTGS